MPEKNISQKEFILQYYKMRPRKEIPHAEVVDWATSEWQNVTGKVLRDPDRAIRSLHQAGMLVKIAKGIYKYDPASTNIRSYVGFTSTDKRIILEQSNFRCCVCGATKDSGAELHIDHIKPVDLGGSSEPSNGQVLCSVHNNQKKNYSQTEFGKKLFINLLEIARSTNDKSMISFINEILDVYAKHKVDFHIK